MYFVNTPWWLKKLFSNYIWDMPKGNNNVYLTFDDGPHPTITPWVIGLLEQHQIKATFFCIGNNAVKYNNVLQQLHSNGHVVANHTYNHKNGFKTPTQTYLQDVKACNEVLQHAKFFRPPYGRIKVSQGRALRKLGYKIIMWQVLSADFDLNCSGEKCLEILKKHTKAGSIVVFHDSDKAWPRLQYALPLYLTWLKENGFNCLALD